MEIKDKKISILLFIILSLTFIFFMPGVIGSDPLTYYIGTENIVKHSTIEIQPDIMEKYNLYGKLPINQKTGGKHIDYGILNSLLMLPLYIVGILFSSIFHQMKTDIIIQFFVSMTGCFISALTGVFLYLLLRQFKFDKKVALFLVLIYSFCTMNFNYTGLNFSESSATLLLVMAFYYLYLYKNNRKNTYLILSSVFIGLTVFTRFTNVILIFPFLIYVASITYKNKEYKTLFKNIVIYSAVFSVFVIILLGINYIKSGVFPSSGYAPAKVRIYSLFNLPVAIAGFIISPEKSIFVFNLPMILSLVYIKKFYNNFKNEFVFITTLFLFNILLYGLLDFWYGGLCWGARYLMPMIVFLILPLAYALEDFGKNKIIRTLIITVVIISCVIQLNSVLFSWYKFDTLIKTDTKFYSLKYSQIPRSFLTMSAYFKRIILRKDLFIRVDGQEINLSTQAKLCPWPPKILRGEFKRDNGEVIILSKKIRYVLYFFFIIMSCVYFFTGIRLKNLLE